MAKACGYRLISLTPAQEKAEERENIQPAANAAAICVKHHLQGLQSEAETTLQQGLVAAPSASHLPRCDSPSYLPRYASKEMDGLVAEHLVGRILKALAL